jgi:hypothetical protein
MYFFLVTTLSIVLTSLFLYKKKNKEVKLLKNKIKELQQIVNKDTILLPIDGIFEIHITIDPEDNYVNLMSYINKYESERSMKIVFAVSNVKNNQYMISHYTRKTNETDAIESANKIAKEMIDFNIKILRIKVESHNGKNIPQTIEEYNIFSQRCLYKPYFEFHVKLSDCDFKTLDGNVKQFPGVAISFNLCSRNRKPLLTIRCYDKGFIDAVLYKDKVLNKFKSLGYVFEDLIQQEFAIYDTNAKLDNGWLT